MAVEYLGPRRGLGRRAAGRGWAGSWSSPRTTRSSDSRWRVFVIDEDGTKLRPVQQVDVPGWTWGTPASSGSVLWATGDKANATAYAVGTYDEKAPFRPWRGSDSDVNALGPGVRHRAVGARAPGRLRTLGPAACSTPRTARSPPAWTLAEAGPALAPPQLAGDLLVLTQQATEGPGVCPLGCRARPPARSAGGPSWAHPGGSPPAPGARGDALVTLGEDGRALALASDRLDRGRVRRSAAAEARRDPAPARPAGPARIGGLGPDGARPRRSRRSPPCPCGDATTSAGSTSPRRSDAAPLFWGSDLLVPGAGGRVDLLDPKTGEARAEPYIEPFDRAHPTRWRAPVALDGDAVALADRSGRVRRLTRSAGPLPRLQVAAENSLGSDLTSDPLGLASAVILVTADGRIRALAARDLSPIGAWPLEAPLAVPPATVAGRGFLADVAGNVHALGPDGQRLWSITLRAGAAAGPPAIAGDSVWFLTRTGALERHALADGALLDRLDLDLVCRRATSRRSSDRLASCVIAVGFGTSTDVSRTEAMTLTHAALSRKKDADVLAPSGALAMAVCGRGSPLCCYSRPGLVRQEAAAARACPAGACWCGPVRPDHAHRRHRPRRRAGQSPAAPSLRSEEGEGPARAWAPRGKGTSSRPAEKAKKDGQRRKGKGGRAASQRDHDPPAQGRRPRLPGEAEQPQASRIFRGHAAGRGRALPAGARLRPRLRVLPAGPGAGAGLGGAGRARRPAPVRRGERGPERRDRRERPAAARRARRAAARLSRPGGQAGDGLRQPDRPRLRAGPVCAGPQGAP